MHVQAEHELPPRRRRVLGADHVVARAGVERPVGRGEGVRARSRHAEAVAECGHEVGAGACELARGPGHGVVRRGHDLELRGRHLELEARIALERVDDLDRPWRQVERVAVEQHQLLFEADRPVLDRLESGPQVGGGGRRIRHGLRRVGRKPLCVRWCRAALSSRIGVMARSIWSGAISFGLVNVPVKLFSAVSRKTVRFNQLNQETGNRIQQKRVDPETGEEVPFEQIVKGFELTKDRYVVITPDELDALDPERTRTIDIEDFVDLDDIDPVYYDHPYYLVPDKGAAKAYGLLLNAMEASGKVAIARVVIRSKEALVAIRPAGDLLMMETMIFHDEVVPHDELDDLPEAKDLKASDRELKMAQQLIDSLSNEFDPSRYRDEYRDKVLDLIERKASGEEIAVQPEAPAPAKVPDLMAALEASLAAVKDDDGGKSDGAAKKKATTKKSSGRAKSPAKA